MYLFFTLFSFCFIKVYFTKALKLQQWYQSHSYRTENIIWPLTALYNQQFLTFDGHYDNWSMLMENFFRSKKYWQVIETGVSELAVAVEVKGFEGKELFVLGN